MLVKNTCTSEPLLPPDHQVQVITVHVGWSCWRLLLVLDLLVLPTPGGVGLLRERVPLATGRVQQWSSWHLQNTR